MKGRYLIRLVASGAIFGVILLGVPWQGMEEGERYVRAMLAGVALAMLCGFAVRYGLAPFVMYRMRQDTSSAVNAAARDVKEWSESFRRR